MALYATVTGINKELVDLFNSLEIRGKPLADEFPPIPLRVKLVYDENEDCTFVEIPNDKDKWGLDWFEFKK